LSFIFQKRFWSSRYRKLAESEGFTIQELVVALVVGSMLVGYAFELYVFTQRIVTRWRHKTELSEVIHSTLNRMTLDLQRADELEIQADSVFVARTDSRVVALYRVSGGIVTRSNVVMNVPSTASLSVEVARVGDMVSISIMGRSDGKEQTASAKVSLQSSSAGKFARSAVLFGKMP
jgi:hypothetical protein